MVFCVLSGNSIVGFVRFEEMDGFDGKFWTLVIVDGGESCKALEKSMEVVETAHGRSDSLTITAFGLRALLCRW